MRTRTWFILAWQSPAPQYMLYNFPSAHTPTYTHTHTLGQTREAQTATRKQSITALNANLMETISERPRWRDTRFIAHQPPPRLVPRRVGLCVCVRVHRVACATCVHRRRYARCAATFLNPSRGRQRAEAALAIAMIFASARSDTSIIHRSGNHGARPACTQTPVGRIVVQRAAAAY